jgi:hypothetical protein
MKGNAIENLIRKLVKQAKAEPQKATVLGVLLAIMLVMVVRMGGPASPASASASIAAPRGSVAADNTRPHVKANGAVAALMKWAGDPIPPALSRNLFVVNYEYFPQDGTKPAPVVHVPHGDGFWDQVAKSLAARADERNARETLRNNLVLMAEKLNLQSTLMSAPPKALINGELVGEGDVVASFRVLRIEAQRIVIEREGIMLEKRLN